jgi:ribosome recycling factor
MGLVPSAFSFSLLVTLISSVNSYAFLTPTACRWNSLSRQNKHQFSVSIGYSISNDPTQSILQSRTRLFMTDKNAKDVSKSSEDRMKKCVESVIKNLNSIRTGRANAAILDRVVVSYYGAPTPLNQLASISVSSAQQLTVEPYDKSIMVDIERGIVDAELGLSPNNDGSAIRINIPALTEARRKELLKQCKSYGEEGKVALRNVRRDGVDSIKKLEKSSDISKDQAKDGTDEMQKLTDKYIKEIDSIVSKKEKEVMTV